ncbi:MAG: hypothetical protein ACFHU9_17905 [Fluviicola sp.]
MMKKIVCISILVFCFNFLGAAQIIHDDAVHDWPQFYAEPMPRASIWLGAEQAESPGILYFGGFSFYEPRYFLFNMKAGYGLNMDASAFFINRTVDHTKTARETIIVVNGDSRFQVDEIPIKATFSFGPKISGNANFRRELHGTADHLSMGMTIHRAKYVDYAKFEGEDGTWTGRMHFDLMAYWFFNHNYLLENFNSQEFLDLYYLEDPRNFGIGIQTSYYTTGNRHSNGAPSGGFRYHMGAGLAPSRSNQFFMTFGAGLVIQSHRSMSFREHRDYQGHL